MTTSVRGKTKRLEAETGKPMREILIEAYKVHGKQSSVARMLGLNPSTVTYWIARCGLREHTILVCNVSDDNTPAA